MAGDFPPIYGNYSEFCFSRIALVMNRFLTARVIIPCTFLFHRQLQDKENAATEIRIEGGG